MREQHDWIGAEVLVRLAVDWRYELSIGAAKHQDAQNPRTWPSRIQVDVRMLCTVHGQHLEPLLQITVVS